MNFISKLSCFLLVIICFILEIRGYNLDVRIPVVKQGEAGSYFGFSVTGHVLRDRTPRAADGYADSIMLVGAPKFNTPEQGLDKPAGAVFKCPLSSETDDCERVINDLQGNEGLEDKNDQWLGVRVDSQGQGGYVGVCAHRYKQKIWSEQKKEITEIHGYGRCWKLFSDLTPYDYAGESIWSPCEGKRRRDPAGNSLSASKSHGLCQAGTGLHMVPHDRAPENWWLAGTPGSGKWRGGFFGTTELSATGGQYTIESTLVNIDDDRPETADESFDKLGVNRNSYLGFSVSAGKFSDDGLQVVAGAPRAENMGVVVIFQARRGGKIVKQYVTYGSSMMESYGYSVCVADLNGDGYDDLIVGAPQYYGRKSDAGGRGYIYLNENKTADFSKVKPTILEGEVGSMFGISVINLGDLDLDGKQDIAIGSPYENNGEGAVYIYHGSEDGIKQPYTQKITPSDLPEDLPIDRLFNYTFGYSLAGGIDLDGNDYPELVVGAFQTDTIVTLRGRPIVEIIAMINSTVDSLDPDIFDCDDIIDGKPTMCFEVFVVMRQDTRSGFFEGETVDVLFSMEAEAERRNKLHRPSRVIFEDSEDTRKYDVTDQRMTLKPKWDEEDTVSKPFKVIIQKGFTDIYRPIPFTLSYELVENIPEMPSPGDPLPDMEKYPILEGAIDGKVKKDEPSLSIDFQKECTKDDGVCITDLSMVVDVNIPGTPPVLRVGEQEEVVITIELLNLNEAAYEAKIVISYPEELQSVLFANKAKEDCESFEAEALITCSLGNPYAPTTKPDIYIFKFDASDVPSDIENFTISINATSVNEDSNTKDNTFEITADVTGITDIQLIVPDDKTQVRYSGEVQGESAFEYEEDIGMLVTHSWEVLNLGPSIVESSLVTIYFPAESSTGKWLLYMTEPPEVLMDKGTCDFDPALINPAGFKKRSEADYSRISPEYDEPVTDLATTVDIIKDNGGKNSPDEDTGETDRNSKRKRDTDQVFRRKGKSDKCEADKVLDCMDENDPDSPRCFQITCTIDALNNKKSAYIRLRSRLWNSTYIEDYIDYHSLCVYSHGRVDILGDTDNLKQDPKNLGNDEAKVITEVFRNLELTPPQRIKWWIILLAVLGGLLLLIILILLLLKCGFFTRRHPPYKYAKVEQVATEKGKTEKIQN